MARVVVDVMLKPEILDPQGQAIARKLPQLGFDGVVAVRQGKRFEVELEGPADEAALERVRRIAETLLANPVIENFEVRVLQPEGLEPDVPDALESRPEGLPEGLPEGSPAESPQVEEGPVPPEGLQGDAKDPTV
ncbi:phosphoribosylformylglycinamidine synthase subunit PurS [Actinomadura sp. LD22]|uniref:Phosphoribosylformylglycinamidine synthase subunit PurS n=1 Tax=Actinomadura physcomitrii TaxID=2650748 RepID=A0A6I4M5W7_9ACTN|nr:phosphoribosylformylglycinamidine synthase subunit PurS [Actinomadura physcomitrii]